jgi:hypothetical protein
LRFDFTRFSFFVAAMPVAVVLGESVLCLKNLFVSFATIKPHCTRPDLSLGFSLNNFSVSSLLFKISFLFIFPQVRLASAGPASWHVVPVGRYGARLPVGRRLPAVAEG